MRTSPSKSSRSVVSAGSQKSAPTDPAFFGGMRKRLEMPAVARWCTLGIAAKRTFTPISKISNEFVEVQGTFALRRISAAEALNDHLERQQHGPSRGRPLTRLPPRALRLA